jgi:hypothetical protein
MHHRVPSPKRGLRENSKNIEENNLLPTKTLPARDTKLRRSRHNDAPVTGLSFALSSSTLASKLLQSSIPFLVSLLLSFERENIGNKNKIEFTLRREKLRIEVESYHVVVVVFFLFGFENEKGKGGLGR